MLNHIETRNNQILQQNEKIQIDVGLLNQLTSNGRYSFESNFYQKKVNIRHLGNLKEKSKSRAPYTRKPAQHFKFSQFINQSNN